MLLIFILFSSLNLFSQSDCTNKNQFIFDARGTQISEQVQELRPDGLILFDNFDGLQSFMEVEDLLNLNPNITFKLSQSNESRLQPGKYISTYQQYYRNIEVIDHGYIDGGGGGHPCAEPSLNNFIISNIGEQINVPTQPTFSKTSIGELIGADNYTSNLIISNSFNSGCQFDLIWEVNYIIDGHLTSFINAHTGDVLRTVPRYSEAGFGDAVCKNKEYSSSSFICPFVTSIIVHEGSGPCDKIKAGDIEGLPIMSPLTPEAEIVVSQMTGVLAIYSEIGVCFDEIHLVIGCSGGSASSDVTGNNAHIKIGSNDLTGNGTTCELLAHELAHKILYRRIKYDEINNVPGVILHEAIADMYAMYVEFMCEGNSDWIRGDGLREGGVDFSVPVCFDGSSDSAKDAPTHWYFLVLTELGMEDGISFLQDITNLLDNNTGFTEFRQAAMLIAALHFPGGVCNPSYNVIGTAFTTVCFPGFTPVDCDQYGFSINPPTIFCEEDERLCLRIGGNTHFSIDYEWQIPPTWSNMTLNDNGSVMCTDFHDYPYYPQYIRICAISSALPTSIAKKCINVTLRDCDGDDPTCEEYRGRPSIGQDYFYTNEVSENLNNDGFDRYKIYNISGQMIYSGTEENPRLILNKYREQILIYEMHNSKNGIFQIEKRLIK